MSFGFYPEDIFAIVLFGIMANFLFSMMFGVLIHKNVGFIEVVKIVRGKRQPWYVGVLLVIPFAKAVLTLWRVYVLQVYFLNKGKSYRDFLLYMVK